MLASGHLPTIRRALNGPRTIDANGARLQETFIMFHFYYQNFAVIYLSSCLDYHQ
jgi:hypothetical protein